MDEIEILKKKNENLKLEIELMRETRKENIKRLPAKIILYNQFIKFLKNQISRNSIALGLMLYIFFYLVEREGILSIKEFGSSLSNVLLGLASIFAVYLSSVQIQKWNRKREFSELHNHKKSNELGLD